MQLLYQQFPPCKLSLIEQINIARGTFAFFFILLIAASPNRGLAQNAYEQPYPGNSRYVEVSAGAGLGRLRDFATSPLFYNGPTSRIAVSLSRLGPLRDISTGIAVQKSTLKNDFNAQQAQSKLTTFSIYHARIYQVFRHSPERWNFKVGAEANLTGGFRINPALMNSAAGIEAFPVLFGTFKVTKNLVGTSRRDGKEPKKKSLSLKVNAGIIGASLRNGYSYLGTGPLIGKPGLDGKLADYRFKAFGVNSLGTSLDYTLWLKNKNGWRFSYNWTAYKTRKDYADFEMASHTLCVALLFNTKNN